MHFPLARLTGSQSHLMLNVSNESSITLYKRKCWEKSKLTNDFGACLSISKQGKRPAAEHLQQMLKGIPCKCHRAVFHSPLSYAKNQKSLRLERIPKIIMPSCQPMFINHIPQYHIHMFLEYFQGQWLHRFPGQPGKQCQCFIALLEKKFFLIFNFTL